MGQQRRENIGRGKHTVLLFRKERIHHRSCNTIAPQAVAAGMPGHKKPGKGNEKLRSELCGALFSGAGGMSPLLALELGTFPRAGAVCH